MVENPYPNFVLQIQCTDHTVTGRIDRNVSTFTNFILALGYCSSCSLFRNKSCSGVEKTGMFTLIKKDENPNSIQEYFAKNNTPCSKAKIFG